MQSFEKEYIEYQEIKWRKKQGYNNRDKGNKTKDIIPAAARAKGAEIWCLAAKQGFFNIIV